MSRTSGGSVSGSKSSGSSSDPSSICSGSTTSSDRPASAATSSSSASACSSFRRDQRARKPFSSTITVSAVSRRLYGRMHSPPYLVYRFVAELPLIELDPVALALDEFPLDMMSVHEGLDPLDHDRRHWDPLHEFLRGIQHILGFVRTHRNLGEIIRLILGRVLPVAQDDVDRGLAAFEIVHVGLGICSVKIDNRATSKIARPPVSGDQIGRAHV